MTDLTETEIDLKLEILRTRLLNCTEGVKEVTFRLKNFPFGQCVHVRIRTVPKFSKDRKEIIRRQLENWIAKLDIGKFTYKIDDRFPFSYPQD